MILKPTHMDPFPLQINKKNKTNSSDFTAVSINREIVNGKCEQ